MAQQGAAFPVRSQQWTAAVEGKDTEFSATGYSDWIVLVATQTGTLGTVMQARCAAPSLRAGRPFPIPVSHDPPWSHQGGNPPSLSHAAWQCVLHSFRTCRIHPGSVLVEAVRVF